MSNDNLIFELLCVDSENTSKIQTVEHLFYSLLSNGELWLSPKQNQKQLKIEDENLVVTLNSMDTKDAPDFVAQKTFRIHALGKFDVVEKFRLRLADHVRKQAMNLVYVLTDEVSEQIARDIYPQLNKVENKLRRYVIKFFVTKLGPDWWKVTADAEMQKKAQQRKNNEKVFSQHVDNKAYLIDFGEIGKIVYAQSSGFISKEDIIEKVMNVEATPEALARLKSEIQSNYTKFFKETFKDKGFQDKWIKLEEIRHKVAHNNLFTKDDFEKANELVKSLLEIIDDAEQKIDEIVFSTDEQAAIQEAIIDTLSQPSYGIYTPITEEQLLLELEKQESFSKVRQGFVGLAHFVKVHLGYQGFDYSNSYTIINSLSERGIIEIYDTESVFGHSVRAIRRVRLNQ